MFCKNCGKEMNDNQAICLECGVKTGDGNKFCQNCGNAVNENAEVCLSCGVALKNSNSVLKDKLVLALLCFFLGEIGIHNFVMGENKKGIFKIILTVGGALLCGIPTIICFVLCIIELVRILTDKYVVDANKLF